MRFIAAVLVVLGACKGKESAPTPVAGSAPATAAETAVFTDPVVPAVDRYRTLAVPEVAAADRPPPPTEAPIALIAALQVSFEGAPVVRVIGGTIDPKARDAQGTITALSELYGAYAKATMPAPALVNIAIVPQMKAGLALDVMESLASAGQRNFSILVRTPEGSGALPVRLGTQASGFAIVVTDAEVRAGSETIPLKAPDVWKRLRTAARAVGHGAVTLQVQSEVRMIDLVPAIIAVRQDDSGEPLATDVAVMRYTPPPERDHAVALQEEAAAYANALAVLASDDDSNSLSAQMEKRKPGSDLGTQLDAVRDSGATVSLGGGRDTRGDRVATGGTPLHGSSVGIDPTRAVPDPAAPPWPTGRISLSSKQSFDESTLTVDLVARKALSAYIAGLRRCYKKALEANPMIAGKLVLDFTVNEAGRVAAPRVTTDDRGQQLCVERTIQNWRFEIPRDPDGEATEARFQLTFQLVPE